MKDRIDVRLSPVESKRLRAVSVERKRSKADTVRILIDEEHERVMAARGETESSAPATRRGE